mgnify:CR=1 FL=1
MLKYVAMFDRLETLLPKINRFLQNVGEPFTLQELKNSIGLKKVYEELLGTFLISFSLAYFFPDPDFENGIWISRHGFFTGKEFPIQISDTETEMGIFIPGSRFLPFLPANKFSHDVKLFYGGKEIPKKRVYLSFDRIFSFYFLYTESDLSNILCEDYEENVETFSRLHDSFNPEARFAVTAWDFSAVFDECNFDYPMRFFVHIKDWANAEFEILKENHDKEDLSLKDHSKKYFKSNFEDEEFTRTKSKKNPLNTKNGIKEKNDNKGKIPDNSKPKPKEYSKKANDKFRKQEKKILKLQHKKQSFEKKLKNKCKDSISSKSAIVAVGAVNRYLESGQEDNAGVSAAHKTTDGIESLARKAHNHGKGRALKRQKRVVRLEKDIEKQEKKLFFKKNMEEFKKSSDYQNTSRLRQFFKRRQYKKQLQKKYKERIKNGLKKSLAKGSKKFAEFIKERGKKIMFLILLVVGTFFMLFQAGAWL